MWAEVTRLLMILAAVLYYLYSFYAIKVKLKAFSPQFRVVLSALILLSIPFVAGVIWK